MTELITRQSASPLDRCSQALKGRNLDALIAVTNQLHGPQSDLAGLDAKNQLLFAEALLEAGRFDSAREVLAAHVSRSPNLETESLIPLFARLVRRLRQNLSLSGASGVALAACAWLDGHYSVAIEEADLALLSDPSAIDALIIKAWALRSQGFAALSEAIVNQLFSRADLMPLDRIELLALRAHLNLDIRANASAAINQFLSARDVPNLPDEASRFFDLLELALAWRVSNVVRVKELLNTLRQHPAVRPYAVALASPSRRRVLATDDAITAITSRVVDATHLEHREAKKAIAEAMSLAEPEQAIWPFIEFGKPVAGLILQVCSDNPSRFAGRLADLFSIPTEMTERPLNQREILVMRMFAAGFTINEIGARLGISRETVKSHSHHVLQKLEVSTRQEALELLRNRGVLPTNPHESNWVIHEVNELPISLAVR